ncbi:UNVERIFIED_CONTAM: hypothetical protein GTU68_065470 [Idotea baltica]|nr:hypothetical protein [Idotea baltica]
MNSEIRERADQLKPRLSSFVKTPREQQTLFSESDSDLAADTNGNSLEESGEQQVPLLLDPSEIVIINLMTAPEAAYEGQSLMRALTESGMRFGEMDIFHYRGKHGDEEPQFRMANLLNPGIFDISNMDKLSTHALCFFFELEPEQDNMRIYESMLSVISGLKDELGGEMRDDQRSVFTIQTSEHCRNRIRDFQRRLLAKKR